MDGPVCSERIEKYFSTLRSDAERAQGIATRCRRKGYDPTDQVEIPFADDLAGRVEKLVGPEGVADRIRELSPTMGRERLCLRVATDVAEELVKAGKDRQKALDQATRTGLAILTEGVLVAPLEGIAEVLLGSNPDGTDYADIYFAGPIRAAGGTAQALSVLIADTVRKAIGVGTFKVTDQEISRTIEEFQLYRNLQYKPSNEEIEKVLKNCPICINGEGTEKEEVQGNRDLPRVRTNQVRSGVCLVIAEGILQKAKKILKITRALEINEWDFLSELREKREGDPAERIKSAAGAGIYDIASPDEVRETSDDFLTDNDIEDDDMMSFVFDEPEGEDRVTLVDRGLENQVEAQQKYIKDLIAGRPVFSHPSRPGGLRLRYGRWRNGGLATIGLNPYTLFATDEFLAVGTQIKIERPGKAGAITSVDSIEGPTVLLDNGDLLRIDDGDTYLRVRNRIRKITDMGEVLIPFGEFAENNHTLVRGSYTEDWWLWDVQCALYQKDHGNEDPFAETLELEERVAGIKEEVQGDLKRMKELGWDKRSDEEKNRLEKEAEERTEKAQNGYLREAAGRAAEVEKAISRYDPGPFVPTSAGEALDVARKLGVPLHPRWTLLWHDITLSELNLLRTHIMEKAGFNGVLSMPVDPQVKEVLIKLMCTHQEREGRILIDEMALPLLRCLGIEEDLRSCRMVEGFDRIENVIDAVNSLSGIRIMERSPTRIGARMGRPEKADLRKMKPPVHCLYPVGFGGGPQRLLRKTFSSPVEANTIPRLCRKCKTLTPYPICPDCGRTTMKQSGESDRQRTMQINSRDDAQRAATMLGFPSVDSLPDMKGVKGLISKERIPERLEKGLLRAKNGVFVFRDGTARYDMTDITMTHFRPKETGTPVEKLREMGYTEDIHGRKLENGDQVLELLVQDIVIHRDCASYLLKVSKFVDEELALVYGEEPYYRAGREDDLVGELCIGLAPHTSAGVLCRIVGFTEAMGCMGHPYFHAAKRRNCDGDEDAVLLLMDGLLNFSKLFLPERRGGQMDAPLVLSMRLDPNEVDKEAHNVDLRSRYPLDFYRATTKAPRVNEYWMERMDTVRSRLGTELQFEGFHFSQDTGDINNAPRVSAYKTIGVTETKIKRQLDLASMIRAVDEDDVAERVLKTHLLPDLIGNLRSYSQQSFRCTKCGSKYRRIPLGGRCSNIIWSPKPHRCNNKLILTVSEGSVKKYLGIAQDIAARYNVSSYLRQRIDLISRSIEEIFPSRFKEATLDTFM